MRIAGSTLAMSGQHTEMESYTKSEQLQFWTGSNPASVADNGRNIRDIVNLSPEAKSLLTGTNMPAAEPVEEKGEEWELSEKDKRMINLIEKFIEVLTGKKIKLVVPGRMENNKAQPWDMPVLAAGQNQNVNGDPGWGLRYEYHEVYKETETLSFAATGSIVTKDGQRIDLNLTFRMQREYISEEHILFAAGNAQIDPLVLNFTAAPAALTEAKFAFDLDMDGIEEQISFAAPGSGLLALDKNGDGIINDGGELFGPQSGDGFSELAAYDQDGNGWIDEDDPIYEQLRIWVKNEAGEDTLLVLGEKGVGAIYLGHIATDFSLKSLTTNQLKGQIRATGLFLKENGMPGTVQHVDLAV